MKSIDEIEFDVEDRHRKGLITEDTTIRLASAWAKKVGAFVKPRIIPGDGIGELDAVLLTDFGVVVLEAKRWAGTITVESGKVRLESSRGSQVRDDPAAKLASTTARLRDSLKNSSRWRSLYAAWNRTGASEPAILGILVFGPTTEGYESLTKDGVTATSTRGLSRALQQLSADRPRLLGSATLASNAAATWAQQGKLRVAGKKGFVRVHLTGSTIEFGDNCWCSLAGVQSVESKGDGRVVITRFGSKKAHRGPTDKIIFDGWFAGGRESVELSTDRRFTWKALHQ